MKRATKQTAKQFKELTREMSAFLCDRSFMGINAPLDEWEGFCQRVFSAFLTAADRDAAEKTFQDLAADQMGLSKAQSSLWFQELWAAFFHRIRPFARA